jgi:hypothetical protein
MIAQVALQQQRKQDSRDRVDGVDGNRPDS